MFGCFFGGRLGRSSGKKSRDSTNYGCNKNDTHWAMCRLSRTYVSKILKETRETVLTNRYKAPDPVTSLSFHAGRRSAMRRKTPTLLLSVETLGARGHGIYCPRWGVLSSPRTSRR